MKIEKVKLTHIKPYWRNPRNNKETVELLKKSINRYGFNVPIVLDKNNVIIAGHARYRALLELDYNEADCVITNMSEEKAKEYRIIDNKTSEKSMWLENELVLEIKELDLDVMRDFFDEDLEVKIGETIKMSGGVNVSEGDYKKAEDSLDKKFKDLSDTDNDRKVEIMCPHCLKTFFMNRK